jgi:hypothetical protein
MVYELAGSPISKMVYDMKGEFYKNERVYKINFTPIYEKLFQTHSNILLKSFIRTIALSLDLL